jgi:SAM-dependent methyltransferase
MLDPYVLVTLKTDEVYGAASPPAMPMIKCPDANSGCVEMMSTDSPKFWDETWAEIGATGSGSDEILAGQIGHLIPGRALEIGCGMGGNAVWLAEKGWHVTAVDYSSVAIEKSAQLAAERGVNIDFVVADASTYRPIGNFDLVTSFYIQLFPVQRAGMLAMMSKALAPGGRLLFVSHDKSGPPSGWSEEDLLSLTSPEEIVRELPDLQIEHSATLNHQDGSSNTIVRATQRK